MIYTQLIITIFVVFAVSRVVLRYQERKLTIYALISWCLLWGLVELIIFKPNITSEIAQILGIGRGADLIIYISIVALFYLIFRIYIKLEDIERQITYLVRQIALKKPVKKIKKTGK